MYLDLLRGKHYSHVEAIEVNGKKISNSFSNLASHQSGRFGPNETPSALQLPSARYPEMSESALRVVVSHIEEPYKFWCQRSDDKSKNQYLSMEELSGPQGSRLIRFDIRNPIRKGHLVMAPFQVDGSNAPEYYRAKVLSYTHSSNGPAFAEVRVYFIDFGNGGKAQVKDLKVFPEEFLYFPPMAFECRLKGVAPKLIKNLKGKWTKEATVWSD